MRLWTVHEPRDPASPGERADKTHFVKDGFCWPGLLVPLPWLLFRRLWLGTLIYVLAAVALGMLGAFLPLTDDANFVLALIANLYVGLEGNDLRRRKLARLGYAQTGSVLAKTAAEAELIYFSQNTTPGSAVARPSVLRTRETDDVIGLFPRPESSR